MLFFSSVTLKSCASAPWDNQSRRGSVVILHCYPGPQRLQFALHEKAGIVSPNRPAWIQIQSFKIMWHTCLSFRGISHWNLPRTHCQKS